MGCVKERVSKRDGVCERESVGWWWWKRVRGRVKVS